MIFRRSTTTLRRRVVEDDDRFTTTLRDTARFSSNPSSSDCVFLICTVVLHPLYHLDRCSMLGDAQDHLWQSIRVHVRKVAHGGKPVSIHMLAQHKLYPESLMSKCRMFPTYRLAQMSKVLVESLYRWILKFLVLFCRCESPRTHVHLCIFLPHLRTQISLYSSNLVDRVP